MIGGPIEMTSSLKTACLSSVVPDLFKALALTKLATLTMAMTVRLYALTKLWDMTIMVSLIILSLVLKERCSYNVPLGGAKFFGDFRPYDF